MSNNISFIGNLGGDAEEKEVNGKPLLSFSVANSVGYGNSKTTQWLRCTIWGSRAKKLGEYLKKGIKVFISGGFKVREYTNKDGEAKFSLEVDVQTIEFAGGKKEEEAPF